MSDMTYAVHTGTCTYLLDDEGVCLWTLSPAGHAAADSDRCVGAQFVACLDLSVPGGLVGELRIGAAALFTRREHGRFVLLRTAAIDRVEHRPSTEAEARAYRDALTSQEATAVLGPEESMALAAREEAPARAPSPPADAAVATHPLPEPWAAPPPMASAALEAQRWAAAQAIARDAATRGGGGMPIPVVAMRPQAPSPIAFQTPSDDEIEVLDAEDLVSISVTEVTLTMPLYRSSPTAPAAPLPPPIAPPRRPSSMPPPPPESVGPPTPRGPPPGLRSVVGPGKRLR